MEGTNEAATDTEVLSLLGVETTQTFTLCGYWEKDDMAESGNYIHTGVNWGYTGAQMSAKLDPMTAIALAAVILLIIFTGYLRYAEELEWYNPETGEIYEGDVPENQPCSYRAVKYRDVEYEVAALVIVPMTLSYRYYGSDEFILNDRTFIQDTGTENVMLYAFDTTEEDNASMETFLTDYTENGNPEIDYESKASYQSEFESMRNMFLLMGSMLSFIIGLVGILNFINAVLTGILTRKREFAVLQSIGMTGRQLKTMLVCEGLFYSLGAVVFSLALALIIGPAASSAVSSMFWFFTYRPTIAPILIVAPLFALLGCVVPLLVYRSAARFTIVERLREAEA